MAGLKNMETLGNPEVVIAVITTHGTPAQEIAWLFFDNLKWHRSSLLLYERLCISLSMSKVPDSKTNM